MEIRLMENLSGAEAAAGLTVIIDVFRAFSLEPWLFSRGCEKIFAVGKKEYAYRMKEEHPEYVLIGERGGVILPGFDYGNSPSQTEGGDFLGKTVVHTTSAGTQGIVAARHASEIITGSLVNARAVAEYIRKKDPRQVSLVCMGLHGTISAPEDVLCGRYIRGILTGEEPDMEKELQILRKTESSERFFRPENAQVFPEGDYWMCTAVDRFDFVLGVKKVSDEIYLVEKTDQRIS